MTDNTLTLHPVESVDADVNEEQIKADTTEARKMINAFINGSNKADRLGLPAMIFAVERLARDKNNVPASILYSRLRERDDRNKTTYARVFAGVIAAYFGEGVVKVKKMTAGDPTPFVIRTDTFVRGVAPRNTWAKVTAETTNAKGETVLLHTYNSKAFREMLAGMFAKDKADPTATEKAAKLATALTKDVKALAINGISKEAARRIFEEAWTAATGGTEVVIEKAA